MAVALLGQESAGCGPQSARLIAIGVFYAKYEAFPLIGCKTNLRAGFLREYQK
jgi:hypothetical protein